MYMELLRLHECRFNTWVSKALNLVQEYGIYINMGSTTCFNRYYKSHINNHFKISLKEEVRNIDKKTILRNYKTFKSEFGMEPYLHLKSDFRYRNALTRLRTSSHTLEIERGRYTTLKTPVCDRRCRTCDVTEDEMHFLLNCVEHGNVRDDFYAKVENRCVGFSSLNDNQKYIFLMTNTDPYILVWLGKLIYQNFIKRNEIIQKFIEKLLSPELYVMLLCHNYENVSIHILLEELVSFNFTFYVQILADVHVCIYVMFLYVFIE